MELFALFKHIAGNGMALSPSVARTRGGRGGLCAVVSCVLAFGLAGCGGLGTGDSLGAAQVRFIDVSPGAPDLDFYVNGTGAAYSLGFANFTSYLPVTPGAANLSVTKSGGSHAVVSAQGTLSGGHQYTAVVSHGLGSLQERLYPDQDTAAPSGQMALRVLNEVEGASAITVYVSAMGAPPAPVSVLNMAAAAASAYMDVPANGSYTITATMAEGALNLPFASVTLKANAGAVHTIVFAGTAQAGAHSAIGFALDDVDAP